MTKTLWCSLLAAGALGGCASTREVPPQLVSARQAQAELQASQAEVYAPAEYDRATRLLMSAECSYASEQDEDRVARRACLARQEAQAARATAEENRLLAQSRQEALKSAQSEAEAQRRSEAAARATAEAESRRLAEAQEKLGFQQTQKGRVLTMTGTTLFGFDSDQLLSTAERKLERVAEVLTAVEEPLILEGYTDSVGNAQYNEQLSERRAAAVKDYLVARGVDAERIRVEARGERDPVAPNDSPEGRALNRRVELVLPAAIGGGGPERGDQPPGSRGTGELPLPRSTEDIGGSGPVSPLPGEARQPGEAPREPLRGVEGPGGSGGAGESRSQQVPAEGTGGSGEGTRQELQEVPLPRSTGDTGGSGPVSPLPGEERQPAEAPREPLRGVEGTGGSGLQPLEPPRGVEGTGGSGLQPFGSGEDTRQELQEMSLPRSTEDIGGSGPAIPLPGEERQPGEAPREPLRGVEGTGGSGLLPLEPLEGETVGGRPPPPGIPRQDLPPPPGADSFEEDSFPMD